MIRFTRTRTTLAALLLGGALALPILPAAHAAPARTFAASLVGNWKNASGPATRNITRLQFYYAGLGQLYVHVYGKCQPVDCDWGSAPVTFPIARPAQAVFRFSFATKTLEIVKQGYEVTAETFTHFTDGSGRQDYHSIDDFIPAL
jgi:hypothetical protein